MTWHHYVSRDIREYQPPDHSSEETFHPSAVSERNPQVQKRKNYLDSDRGCMWHFHIFPGEELSSDSIKTCVSLCSSIILMCNSCRLQRIYYFSPITGNKGWFRTVCLSSSRICTSGTESLSSTIG